MALRDSAEDGIPGIRVSIVGIFLGRMCCDGVLLGADKTVLFIGCGVEKIGFCVRVEMWFLWEFSGWIVFPRLC